MLYKYGVAGLRNGVLIIYALLTYLLLPFSGEQITPGAILGSSFLSALVGIWLHYFKCLFWYLLTVFTAYL